MSLNLDTLMAGRDRLHIVVFPWLAFGHMRPFLELSKSLARRGHHIFFISTPRNIQRLPLIPPEISNLIIFIPFTLPRTDGLPETAEATSDLSPEEAPLLKKALDGLEQPFSEFVKQMSPRPDWIIQDSLQHWIPKIAREVNALCIYLTTFPAAIHVFFGMEKVAQKALRMTPEEFTVPPPWIPFPSKLAYRLHEAKKLFEDYLKSKRSGVSDGYRIRVVVESCNAMAIRSCIEVEENWLRVFEQIHDMPIIPVGLLPPSIEDERVDEEGSRVIRWLDGQMPGSVIYVAFGTEVALSDELTHELALGLELSNLPFLWALRTHANTLPEGFEGRTRDHGLVAKGRVPQLKMLAHESIGGFLTHAGWGSVIESLQFGHPLVLLPIFGDQGLNARLMEENGFGIEVERNEEDGKFTKEAVAKVLKMVMIDEEGELYRKKAQESKKTFANKERHEQYVDVFVQYLQNNRNQSKRDESP